MCLYVEKIPKYKSTETVHFFKYIKATYKNNRMRLSSFMVGAEIAHTKPIVPHLTLHDRDKDAIAKQFHRWKRFKKKDRATAPYAYQPSITKGVLHAYRAKTVKEKGTIGPFFAKSSVQAMDDALVFQLYIPIKARKCDILYIGKSHDVGLLQYTVDKETIEQLKEYCKVMTLLMNRVQSTPQQLIQELLIKNKGVFDA